MALSDKKRDTAQTSKKGEMQRIEINDQYHHAIEFIREILKGLTGSSIDGILKHVSKRLLSLELVEASGIIAFDTREKSLLVISLDIYPGAVSLNVPIPERMRNGEAVEKLMEECCALTSPAKLKSGQIERFFRLALDGVGAEEEIAAIAMGGLRGIRSSSGWVFAREVVGDSKGFYLFLLPAGGSRKEGSEIIEEIVDILSELVRSRAEVDGLNLELERYAAVIEAQIGTFFLLVDGRIEFFTSGLSELIGAQGVALRGKRFSDFLDRDDATAFERAVETYSEGSLDSHVRRYYRVYRTADGRRELEISLEPVLFEGRNAIRGEVRDRNERGEIERMALDGKHLESLATLAGGVAHDFNNLLGAILGYTSLLKNSLEGSEESLKYIGKIEEAGTRAVELARQLLFMSRKGKYRNEVIDLGGILSRISKSCAMPMSKVSLVQNLNAKNRNILGDPSQIYEAFLNVCMNARESMPDGGTIEIETDNVYLDYNSSLLGPGMKEGEYIRVKIRDSGSGMQPDILRRASAPFFTTKKREGQRGLGLPVAIGIIESHAGKLLMRSEPGEGTEVTVLLPITYSSITEDMPYAEGAYEKLKVLVVDDEEIVCSLVSDMLKAMGIESVPTYSGKEALKLVEQEAIDLVILDLVMPEMNGQEVFYRLKESHPEIPVIVSSGFVDETTVHKLLADGAMSFLKKPYVLEDLEGAVKKAAGLMRAARER